MVDKLIKSWLIVSDELIKSKDVICKTVISKLESDVIKYKQKINELEVNS